MQPPFRFLHAADLHLDRPVRGLAEVPDHLRTALFDAPYRAAERVFDAAIKERVDFVVIAGDLIDPLAAGPRGLIFVSEQFQKLADKGIRVYWTGGGGDDFDRWAETWSLGENVVRFPLHRVLRIVHERAGEPVAQILGASASQRKRIRTHEFHPDGTPLFSVAVAYGSTDTQAVAQQGINYWALGGEHDRRTLASGPVTAHYPGTTQGRRPQESGPRGCTLVQVDNAGRVRTSLVATDAVRFQTERISLVSPAHIDQLDAAIKERLADLLSDPFGPDLLIHWSIAADTAFCDALRRGTQASELIARLQADYGPRRPAAWTVALEPEEPATIRPELYQEATVLGEFLRMVDRYVEHPDEALDLESYLAERYAGGTLGAAVALDEPAVRRRILTEAARLGVELLSPEETRS